MRDRAHLGKEKRQHSQGRDAEFDAMRPFEQGQPFTQKQADANTVRTNRELPISDRIERRGQIRDQVVGVLDAD